MRFDLRSKASLKIRIMQLKNYFGLLAVTVLFACAGNNAADDKSNDNADNLAQTDTSSVVIPSFKDEKLGGVYNGYISLKDHLVATNFENAQPAAAQLSTLLKTQEGCENATVLAQKIADSKDIKAQRAAFTALNMELIPLFKHAELTAGSIYVQNCPMANKGDGGDWLSSVKKIQNPYYGDEMMECGSVIETVTTK